MRIRLLLASALLFGAGPAAGADGPSLQWQACSEAALEALECATLGVPKDHNDPARGSFTLAVARAKAGKDEKRIGSLFFNPGGPGVSGIDTLAEMLPYLPGNLLDRFDVITWDPRGVGRSSGLTDCPDGRYTLPPAGPVDWNKSIVDMRAAALKANSDCAERYPDIIPYISTRATARDLDRLREAAGDTSLTFWGTSYGTRIGYVYAQLFPDRVRAMLLTSPVDPNATWKSFVAGSATSPDNAVGFLFQLHPKARDTFTRIMPILETAALELPSGRKVTRWDLRAQLAIFAKSESSFGEAETLLGLVDQALHGGVEEKRSALAALDAEEWQTDYPINSGATVFIGCSDYADRYSPDEQVAESARIRVQAPIFGFGTSQGLFYCEGIKTAPDPVPTDFVNPTTPMLIIASTRDGLTQYGWATEMARNFQDSRVITYIGTQHTPYVAARSACVDAYATDYLINLRRPVTDTACRNAASSQ
jgi:pimeloyl-ACP methyl ester carboxylesterase